MPYPAAVILISSRPPGTTDGAVKDLEALWVCAPTGPGCNSPTTPKAAPAITNSAHAFLINALSFSFSVFSTF